MPKINVYLPGELATAVRDAQIPVSAICQAALQAAVRDVGALRGSDQPPIGDPAHGPFGRFTARARAAIAAAQREAAERRHGSVGTEHLLLGILDEGGNLALTVLGDLDVEPDDVRAELVASMGPSGSEVVVPAPFTALSKKVLEQTAKEALGMGHNYIGCEHLLLGLIAVEEGTASQVLRRMGVELRTTRLTVTTALSGFTFARGQGAAAASAGAGPAAGPLVPPAALEEILRRLDAIESRLAG
jgi:ATP-dependent Clp protease ATP-binding subunit ClpA